MRMRVNLDTQRVELDGRECRLDVFKDDWDRLLNKFNRLPTRWKVTLDGRRVELDGHECRLDVFQDKWMRLLTRFEEIPALHKGGVDAAVLGNCRLGSTRLGVKIPLFDELKERLKKLG